MADGETTAAPRPEDRRSAAPTDSVPDRRSREEALLQVTGEATEVTSTGDVVDGGGEYGGLGGRTLSNLLKVHVFTSFFCWLADRQFPSSHRPETRVSRLREKNPKFYWICVTLDLVVGFVAVVILIAAATGVLYKTLVL